MTRPDTKRLVPTERRLKRGLQVLSALFALSAFGYLLPSLLGPWKVSFIQLPFVTNSVVKISVLGFLAFLASGNIRHYRQLVIILLLGHVVSELAMLAVLVFGDLHPPLWPPSGLSVSMRSALLGGEILFAAGAEEVMPHTFSYRTFRRTEQDAFREFPGTVKDASDITMGTGHPQGGNCLSGKDAIGVVTPEFKVRGYGNLFVCDASTFPTSVGVNPQVTVMTLAHYAARFVGARC